MVREVELYGRFLRRGRKRPLILFNPCDGEPGWGSELRGSRVAEILYAEQGIDALHVPSHLTNAQRRRLGRLLAPDVVVHQAFMNERADPADFPRAVNVIDLDDAHFNVSHLRDTFAAKVRACDAAVAGSRYTREWLERYLDEVEMLWTPSPITVLSGPPQPERSGDVVVWATTDPLNYRREAELVRDTARELARMRPMELLVVGSADHAALQEHFSPVVAAGGTLTHVPNLPYDDFLIVLQRASVGLAPLFPDDFSAGKSFGKVLAYIASGVPVVTSDAVDHPLFFRSGENGFLASSPESWVTAVDGLLADSEARERMAQQAFEDMQAHMSVRGFARRLHAFLERQLALKASA